MSQFSDTILLPKTHFSMRANLSQTEKKWIEFWDEINLIEKVKEKKKKKDLYFMMALHMQMVIYI